MKRIKNSLKITAILCVFFFLLSCDLTVSDSDKSSIILTITRIHGMDLDGNDVDYIMSDVITEGNYLTNPVTVTIEAKFKNPEPFVPGSSYKTSIMIDRYTVTYTSPEGDPVPVSFEGRLSAICEVDASVDLEILAVRAEAKAAAPLNTLSGTDVIWAVAEISIIGHDLADNGVEATGYLTIYFADWADS